MSGSSRCRFLRSTVGMKVLMAITGVVLFGFVAGHVLGNMLVFAGREKMDAYGRFLHTSPGILWGTRISLLASVAVHIWASIRLTSLKAAARPVPYETKEALGSSFASRTMMWSGPIIAGFVIYHLLHFTTGHMHPDHATKAGFSIESPYHNLVVGFSRVGPSLVYIVCMVLLGLHLSHGLWSMLQTVGVNRPNWDRGLRCLSVVFAVLICGGFIAVPVAVLAGIVK